jgi:hypothetical protein
VKTLHPEISNGDGREDLPKPPPTRFSANDITAPVMIGKPARSLTLRGQLQLDVVKIIIMHC